MIDLYYWPTPNGHKITIFLEEVGLNYSIHPIDISAGDQFKPEFLAFSPNNRMPAIIDTDPADAGEPITVFESGAILLYLAEKTGRFMPTDIRGRKTVTEWLFWQMGGLGPMAGQNHHFGIYAPEKLPYAINRYVNETNRLYGVINRRLADRAFLAGENYTIADMAAYPWIVPWKRQQQNLDDFANLRRWFDAIRERPATVRAYAKGEPYASSTRRHRRRQEDPIRTDCRERRKKLSFGANLWKLLWPHRNGDERALLSGGRRSTRGQRLAPSLTFMSAPFTTAVDSHNVVSGTRASTGDASRCRDGFIAAAFGRCNSSPTVEGSK